MKLLGLRLASVFAAMRLGALLSRSCAFLLASLLAAGPALAGPASSHRPMLLDAAQLIGGDSGWASDGASVVITHDNGRVWQDITPVAARGAIDGVMFTDPTHGWVVAAPAMLQGDLAVYGTQDAGQRWALLGSLALSPLERGATTQSLVMHADGKGWLMLRLRSSSNFNIGRLFATRDGGHTWQRLSTPPAAGKIRFITSLEGTLTASRGKSGAWLTQDGGNSWLAMASNTTADTPELVQGRNLLAREMNPDEAVVSAQLDASDNGWVMLQGGSCAAFKSQCSQHTRLFRLLSGVATEITPHAFPSPAQPASVEVLTGGLGFDQCEAATASATNAWWPNTPWRWTNIYIGGSMRGCSQPNLDSDWVASVLGIGFKLVPTWVGPQAPGNECCQDLISTNASAAYAEGKSEANLATNAADALGLTAPTIIYYDMEAYAPEDQAAVNAFMSGWVDQMHANGNLAGVYGSPYNLRHYHDLSSRPDAVWIGAWNGNEDVYNITGLSNSYWNDHERLHQYRGEHDSTYNGVTFNIDTSSTDGPLAAGDTDRIFRDGFDPSGLPDVSMALVVVQSQVEPFRGEQPGLAGNADVERVQQALTQEGFTTGVDGWFGNQTAAAYSAWQTSLGYSGLGANGIPGPSSLAALGQGRFGIVAPVAIGSHTSFDGKEVNQRTRDMLVQAESLLGRNLNLYQGSYNPGGVGNSAGTHDGGGAVDIKLEGFTTTGIWEAVKALRTVGFAAWFRPQTDDWPDHIHAIAIADTDLSIPARDQVADYYVGRNGLGNHGLDNTPSAYRVAFTWWESYQSIDP